MEAIPYKVWMRATDALAEYCNAGEAFVACGKKKNSAEERALIKAEIEYNKAADRIWFSRWTKEQREEWGRINR